jgi:menaquinone-specific isochorismate synthase
MVDPPAPAAAVHYRGGVTSAPSVSTDPASALTVRSVPIAAPDAPLAALLPNRDGTLWSRHGEGLIGWGTAAEMRCAGPDRFERAADWWRRTVRRAVVRDEATASGSGLVALGAFTYSAGSAARSVLRVPRFAVGHRGGRWWATTVGTDGELPPLPPALRRVAVRPAGQPRFADGARSSARWQEAVSAAVARIAAGQLDKVVLARDLEARTDGPIDPRWLIGRLAERYPSCYTYAVDGLVGSTPELLVRVAGRLVTSRVLAGTIRRTGSLARDEALAGSLARSSKDLEEHEYAVASVADALAPYCTAMNVPEAPFVLHLPNVMHLATDVTGVLGDGQSALDLAAALHPTAAVCGTPRAAADRLITELEGMDRARYAGAVGWIGADGTGEFGIALRSGELDPTDPRHIRLFAGCGIVAESDPAAELAESNAKLVPMRDALSP